MANRAYLFSLGNRPQSYSDRPDTLSGLSEWAYEVPFCFRVLMSGDPELCASFVSDGFDDEPADRKTRIHAISADFELGFARLQRFFEILRALHETAPGLLTQMDEATTFLEEHRDRYLLLETVELDMMSAEGGPALRASVETEIAACRRVAAAFDALPTDIAQASEVLKASTAEQASGPLSAFFGLRFDEYFDHTRDGHAKHPLGLSEWSEVLYFQLWNRAEFEANRAEAGDAKRAEPSEPVFVPPPPLDTRAAQNRRVGIALVVLLMIALAIKFLTSR